MQNVQRKENANKGASLVLVIVCLLFVGIIAAAILTLTSGNISSNKTNEGSNDNFYSAESIIDDLKIYLQKVANGAATRAYAKVLDDKASSVSYSGKTEEEVYKEYYSTFLKADLEKVLGTGGELRSWLETDDYAKLGINDSLVSGIELVVGSGVEHGVDQFDKVYDASSNTLKGITLRFTDGSNYTTSIDTDLQFDCAMPPLEYENDGSSYPFDIDKFLIISEKGIMSKSGGDISGSMTGNLYSGGDIDFTIASVSGPTGTGTVNLFSQYIISRGDFNVSNGNLNLKSLQSAGSAVQYLTLKRSPSENKAVIKDGQSDATLYVNGINLKDGAPKVTVYDSAAEIYVKDDLSLIGNGSSFVMKDGKYFGFSSDGTTAKTEGGIRYTVSKHEDSSAMIVNGVNSVLDLSNAAQVTLAGTAYTQVPSIAGATPEDGYSYFVQGESITYKSLQSAYLVPGNAIKVGSKVVGMNPIPSSYEGLNSVADISVDETKVGKDAFGNNIKLSDDTFRVTTVRYTNSSADVYYYVYWDFEKADEAVKYFNANYASNKEVFESKIGMIGSSGRISLPADEKLITKGDRISWSGSALSHKAGNWASKSTIYDGSCDTYADKYENFLTGLSESGASNDVLWDNLFSGGDATLADTSGHWTLKGPANWENDKYSGTGNVILASGGDDATEYQYVLVTGDSISLNAVDPNVKYVVVSSGDVKIDGSFNGLVIAKGTVTIDGSVNMKCFGNFKNTLYNKETKTTTTEYISEFDALLNVVVDDSDMTNGNTVLRSIFGVVGGSASTGGDDGKANNIASVNTTNYKKN